MRVNVEFMNKPVELPVIGITMGDPNGIGPEVILRALSVGIPFTACRPVVFGDLEVLSRTLSALDLPGELEPVESIPDEGFRVGKVVVISPSRLKGGPLCRGETDRTCGEAMVAYIEEAVRWVMAKKLDAITTCPINKQAIHRAGYAFPGHTELLAHLAKVSSVAMMFLGSKWKVVLVTTHVPLRAVPLSITKERVLNTIRLAGEGLRKLYGISHPNIAVLGLNPHCGEGGLLGDEEKEEILPAIQEAKLLGIKIEGPFPADSFFNLSASREPFDAVIAMYHDQGLIPVKMLDFTSAVNVTLGLPFIRTSVAHGTAYDIVGKGVANPRNLIETLLVTSHLCKSNRN